MLVLGLALLAGQRIVTTPFAALSSALGVLWFARHHLSRLAWIATFLFLMIGITWARFNTHRMESSLQQARIALSHPSRCEAFAQVQTSPVRKDQGMQWQAELTSLVCEERTLPGSWRAKLYGGPENLARGDTLHLFADLAPVQFFSNPELPDPLPATTRSGATISGSIVFWEYLSHGRGLRAGVDRARARVRTRIDATYAHNAAPLARALVLGETDLSTDDLEAFQKSGLAHLLAVSGTHLVLVVMSLVSVLQKVLVRLYQLAARVDAGQVAALVGIPIAFLYADFAGGSGSSWRAALMLSASLGARVLGRRTTGSRALGLSLLARGLTDPLAAFDLSFLLSVAATAGLFLFTAPIQQTLCRYIPISKPIAPLIGMSLGASLACAPFLATLAAGLPLLGLLANLLAVPLGESFALPVCLAHTLLDVFPLAERSAALAGSGALLLVRWIARIAAAPRWTTLSVPPPTELHAIALAWGGTALLMTPRRARLAPAFITIAALLIAEGIAIRFGTPKGYLRITALNVGQGDAALIDMPDGRALVVDGGGLVGSTLDTGKSILLPLLRMRRRSKIDIAVLSHPHPDHFLGLASALPKLNIGEFWDTGQGQQEGAGTTYAQLIKSLQEHHTLIKTPESLCNKPMLFGGATLEVLAPCPSYTPHLNPNNNSFVLRLSWGHRVALLMGDAEADEERWLSERYGDKLHADYLKVGHHGSRTSTTPLFLTHVHPTFAIISSGVRNRFGHPHPNTLTTLNTAGATILRTDVGGIVWQTDGNLMGVQQGAQDSTQMHHISSQGLDFVYNNPLRMIKYIGSKRPLLPHIITLFQGLPGIHTVLDLFSGTARVGHALKAAGFRTVSNDHNAYAHCLANCYVAADRTKMERPARLLLREFQKLPGKFGYFTETYCLHSRFFQPKNGERIDAIRESIERKGLPPDLRSVVLVSLMEAADRVDSTCGLQMAYLKWWAPRSYNDLELRMPLCLPGPGSAHRLDAEKAAELFDVDAAYLDPPYNQHSYLSNYHIWESLILWDKPSVYGIACKRIDCRQRISAFNSKRTILEAFSRIIDKLRTRYLVLSFNNEGHLSLQELLPILRRRGHVTVFEYDSKRYVGAQIGIYNPSGKRVGSVSHLRNKEFLFVVSDDAPAIRSLC